ncbi:Methyltransferase domain-containing protein [Tistlia consotensis]|uniref:Methyltransferase domain-containing protein n=1 Tax=Tistlia consotensis USBA 355 TaxID=560819 RepID=A0A1Y6CMV2_9PROT|nr:class I SAM-dependent methyltransferase [Tistlia consotensis]SMF78462.1 Methyltransferase domain-containing protein [Tistlia consotensis USBA 355]SNS18572.1 Methyltransferase domain-containing protein [Tistlia consotensis]
MSASGESDPSEPASAGDRQPLLRAAFAFGQAARVAAYWGQYALSKRLTRPVRPPRPIEGQGPGLGAVLQDLRALLRRDWQNVAEGRYRPPHDLIEAPFRALAAAPRFLSDLPQVERRRHAGRHDEVYRTPPEGGAGSGPDGGRYPRYYLQNFHYQTDGWLSAESAALYDHQVEVLFVGGADAMRRQALVPLEAFLRDRPKAETRLLDLGCGTGRFLSFVKDNYPRLPVTALDLSPAYLEAARRQLAPWRGVAFVQAAAEATGLPDASFDVVTAVYLFHELPPPVRRQVLREAARLLRPGGLFVLVDSLQKGDHPPYDPLLDYFPVAFHEPYHASYVTADLAALLRGAGLEPGGVERAFFSRIMTARKQDRVEQVWRELRV